jgi:hypothetical protein
MRTRALQADAALAARYLANAQLASACWTERRLLVAT